MAKNLDLKFTTDIVINLLSLLILVLLMIQLLHRKKKTPEIKYLFLMCIFSSLLSFTGTYLSFYLMFLKVLSNPVGDVIAYAIDSLQDTTFLLLIVFWLHFVEYTLHQSKDLIMRRYRYAMVPFYIAAGIKGLRILVPLLPLPGELYIDGYYVIDILNKAASLIWIFYILTAHVIAHRERKRMAIPRYIRLVPTEVCIILGVGLNILLGYRTVSLGCAAGLMFADYFLFRRLSWIDKETGFYNESYLPVLKREAEKKNLKEITIIRFKALDDRDGFAGILRYWEPEHSKIVAKDNGEFLVLSNVLENAVIKRFISLVLEEAQNEGIHAEVDYETRR